MHQSAGEDRPQTQPLQVTIHSNMLVGQRRQPQLLQEAINTGRSSTRSLLPQALRSCREPTVFSFTRQNMSEPTVSTRQGHRPMTPGTKNKRKTAMLLRRADLAQLFLRGERNQAKLADRLAELGHERVTQKTISVDLAELRAFARHLRRDYDAVRAGLSLPWSNGQVEGQIHRLKLIKRQMYGRANFDLLRKRVLYAPG